MGVPSFETEKEGDTTVYLAQNFLGNVAGGASSSGLPYKYPARLDDSPVICAGLYFDNCYGANEVSVVSQSEGLGR